MSAQDLVIRHCGSGRIIDVLLAELEYSRKWNVLDDPASKQLAK
jgi:hypothetical protein